jgi:branched-chain amino acid transport system ATP-binding protein
LPDDALRLEAINTRYGDSHVLHDVSLRLSEGRVLTLLGRNGAGKTTTMHSIIGFQPVSSGTVTLFGNPIMHCTPEQIARQGIALVPQGRRIFKSLGVEENLTVARRPGSKPRFDFEVLYAWFPRLKERRRQPAGSLSGGEQQMLAIARALIANPEVVLFDEPSEGLAPQIVEEVGVILGRLKAAGLSIILVEQNIKLALGIADEVAILNTGRVIYTGSVADVASDPEFLNQHLGVH